MASYNAITDVLLRRDYAVCMHENVFSFFLSIYPKCGAPEDVNLLCNNMIQQYKNAKKVHKKTTCCKTSYNKKKNCNQT